MNPFDLNDLIADHHRQDYNQDHAFETRLSSPGRAVCFQMAFPNRWSGRDVAVRDHMRRYHSN